MSMPSTHLPLVSLVLVIVFVSDMATPAISTLSLHDALPIFIGVPGPVATTRPPWTWRLSTAVGGRRSEEHTSELQSHHDLVCRLLLEKKKVADMRMAVHDVSEFGNRCGAAVAPTRRPCRIVS